MSSKVAVLVMQHHVVFVKNATSEVETAYAKAVVFQSHLTKGLVYALISARPARPSRLGPSSLVFCRTAEKESSGFPEAFHINIPPLGILRQNGPYARPTDVSPRTGSHCVEETKLLSGASLNIFSSSLWHMTAPIEKLNFANTRKDQVGFTLLVY